MSEMGGKALIVKMMDRCNNGCRVCFERGRSYPKEQREIELLLELGREQGAEQVTFTGREPTLHDSLPALVTAARELGYLVIQLVTNGRLMAYRDLARALVVAGVTEVLVPLWAPGADEHDEMTRVAGSFAQAVRGIRALSAVSRQEGAPARAVAVTIGAPVTRANVGRLAEMVPLARRLEAVELSFVRQRDAVVPPPPLDEVREALLVALEAARRLTLPISLHGFEPFEDSRLDDLRVEEAADFTLAPFLISAEAEEEC